MLPNSQTSSTATFSGGLSTPGYFGPVDVGVKALRARERQEDQNAEMEIYER